MKKIQRHIGWAVVLSELSHVFCCVIPTLVTALSAFANIGLFVVSPNGLLMHIHEMMHDYEVPVIIFSGVMVALGWVAHMASRDVDCHDTGCSHPPCSSAKQRNSKILLVASVLFLANMVIYFGVHRNILDLEIFHTGEEQAHDHDHDHDHPHE